MKYFSVVCGSLLLAAAAFSQTAAVQPKTFDTPDAAAQALIEASAQNDTGQLAAILGTSAKGVMTSGDAAQDKEERAEFAKLAMSKHRIEHSSMDSKFAVLMVGDQDWPFPVPLLRSNGKWRFDPESGAVEMQARRIGADELDAIEICMGYVGAQEAFAASGHSHAYAQKIMNGLYQPGKKPELVPEGFAAADASLQTKKPYHGYYFRVLNGQGSNAPGGAHRYIAGNAMIGGFALIAWPAQYGVDGIHTFIVNQDGQVFEKDFGAQTALLVKPITRYDPDGSWSPVD